MAQKALGVLIAKELLATALSSSVDWKLSSVHINFRNSWAKEDICCAVTESDFSSVLAVNNWHKASFVSSILKSETTLDTPANKNLLVSKMGYFPDLLCLLLRPLLHK